MEKPVDGNNLPAEIGNRIIDKPELPAQGVTTDNEVWPGWTVQWVDGVKPRQVFVYFERGRRGGRTPHQTAARPPPHRGSEPPRPGVGGRF